jgi:exosortase
MDLTTRAATAARPEIASATTRPVIFAVFAVALALAVYAPILWYMGLHWYGVEDYSHGFLIGPLALYFAWERRPQLRRARIEPSWWGLVPLGLATVTLTVGRLGVELMNMRVAFVLTLMGLVLLLLGRPIFRILLFPLAFLFLMVPLPQSLVNVVAFPLQLVAADWAVQLLYYLRIPALREGNIIHLPDTTLFVAEACSGLRSLMALITLGVVFAYFFRRSWGERIVIVASAIPIAIIVNALRVALSGILTYRFGEQAAEGVIHEFQGLITFGAAFVLLLAEAWVLGRVWPERWRPKRTPARRRKLPSPTDAAGRTTSGGPTKGSER